MYSLYLQNHVIIHHERIHECSKCIKTFATQKKLIDHQNQRHRTLPFKKRLKIRRKNVDSDPIDMATSSMTKHNPQCQIKSYTCKFCYKPLSTSSTLNSKGFI